MQGEAFWGLKNPDNPGASLSSSPWTPAGSLPPPPGLPRGPHQGPHAVKTLRLLCSTWTQTIFIQHPAVTNPAHAHGKGGKKFVSEQELLPVYYIYFATHQVLSEKEQFWNPVCNV